MSLNQHKQNEKKDNQYTDETEELKDDGTNDPEFEKIFDALNKKAGEFEMELAHQFKEASEEYIGSLMRICISNGMDRHKAIKLAHNKFDLHVKKHLCKLLIFQVRNKEQIEDGKYQFIKRNKSLCTRLEKYQNMAQEKILSVLYPSVKEISEREEEEEEKIDEKTKQKNDRHIQNMRKKNEIHEVYTARRDEFLEKYTRIGLANGLTKDEAPLYGENAFKIYIDRELKQQITYQVNNKECIDEGRGFYVKTRQLIQDNLDELDQMAQEQIIKKCYYPLKEHPLPPRRPGWIYSKDGYEEEKVNDDKLRYYRYEKDGCIGKREMNPKPGEMYYLELNGNTYPVVFKVDENDGNDDNLDHEDEEKKQDDQESLYIKKYEKYITMTENERKEDMIKKIYCKGMSRAIEQKYAQEIAEREYKECIDKTLIRWNKYESKYGAKFFEMDIFRNLVKKLFNKERKAMQQLKRYRKCFECGNMVKNIKKCKKCKNCFVCGQKCWKRIWNRIHSEECGK